MPTTVRLFVRNASYEATEKDVRDFFYPLDLKEVLFPKKPDTGERAGFIFVDVDERDVDNALAFSHKEMLGRAVGIERAKEREK